VYGSRFLAAPYRRAMMFRHSVMNRGLTFISNVFTDLDLTDVETCYKAVRTLLLKSIPLRSNDFRIEVELTMKLAKRRAQVFEVPIRYLPRSYREGKKIGAKDGVLALAAFLRFAVVDDLYHDDEYGSHILHQLERTRRFNVWLCDALRPFVGDRVLEIGAGIGNLTSQFIPRDEYCASDVNPTYLHYLSSYAAGKPYLEVRKVDAGAPDDFKPLEGRFDTVLMINVLEHLADEQVALRNVRSALAPGGRAIILVPQFPNLYSSLDVALGHRERYTREGLSRSLQTAGLVEERMFDFNRASVPGWWFNGVVLKRTTFSRVQLKVFDLAVPVLRHLDHLLPYGGQSVVAIARRDD
jgi:SAM-dependent methyltransferase